jgi:hypothetical protein
MAVLFITEYAEIALGGAGRIGQIPAEPPLAEQTVAIGAGSVQSNALNAQTRIVRLHTDAICSVLLGTNPTATAASRRLAAGQTEYFGVPRGSGLKVAVIQNT